MNFNKHDEVINGELSYIFIARKLEDGQPVFIGWTDEESVHYDILFTYGNVASYGGHQRGIKPNYLFVSIMDHTSYGFVPDTLKEEGYIQEKFHFGFDCKKLTELINGIIKELNKNAI